jgi:hypothetical protein
MLPSPRIFVWKIGGCVDAGRLVHSIEDERTDDLVDVAGGDIHPAGGHQR